MVYFDKPFISFPARVRNDERFVSGPPIGGLFVSARRNGQGPQVVAFVDTCRARLAVFVGPKSTLSSRLPRRNDAPATR